MITVAVRWYLRYGLVLPGRPLTSSGRSSTCCCPSSGTPRPARKFFTRARRHGPAPVEVTTDKAGPYLRVIDELVPTAAHVTEQYDTDEIVKGPARAAA